jgi:hypothetical protein
VTTTGIPEPATFIATFRSRRGEVARGVNFTIKVLRSQLVLPAPFPVMVASKECEQHPEVLLPGYNSDTTTFDVKLTWFSLEMYKGVLASVTLVAVGFFVRSWSRNRRRRAEKFPVSATWIEYCKDCPPVKTVEELDALLKELSERPSSCNSSLLEPFVEEEEDSLSGDKLTVIVSPNGPGRVLPAKTFVLGVWNPPQSETEEKKIPFPRQLDYDDCVKKGKVQEVIRQWLASYDAPAKGGKVLNPTTVNVYINVGAIASRDARSVYDRSAGFRVTPTHNELELVLQELLEEICRSGRTFRVVTFGADLRSGKSSKKDRIKAFNVVRFPGWFAEKVLHRMKKMD